MLPLTRAIHLYQGDSFSLKFRLKTKDASEPPVVTPVNLTGCTVKAQIRTFETETPEVVAEFASTITDAANGEVELKLTPEQTAEIEGGRWDVQVTFADGSVKTYIRGNVAVKSQVTL